MQKTSIKMTMKQVHFGCKSFTLSLLVLTLNVQAGELESAIQAALENTPAGPVDVFKPTFQLFKHDFSVQPVELLEKHKGKFTLMGKLTRIARASDLNDEIIYRIIKEKGAVKEIAWQVNGGEWRSLSEPIMNALGDYRSGGPMPEEKQREVERALEKAVDGTWQRAAEFLIAHIAVRHC
jgi:hypothetical protein